MTYNILTDQPASLIDGKKMAEEIERSIKQCLEAEDIRPCLAILSFGSDPASAVYVRSKVAACSRLGYMCQTVSLPESDVDRGMEILMRWAEDPTIHGIIVQLPAPEAGTLLKLIPPYKDVDGLRPDSRFKPCTALAVMHLIGEKDLSGYHAVVVGRSEIVGKPVAKLLLDADATITVCHSKTEDLGAITSQADILIVAAGKQDLITADMVKPGATVIDVGINRDPTTNKLVGDVDFSMVKYVAGQITPVPGGVGPMTVAMLMENVYQAAKMQTWKED